MDKHRMSREDLLIAENRHGNSQRKKITRSTSYEMNMNNFNWTRDEVEVGAPEAIRRDILYIYPYLNLF